MGGTLFFTADDGVHGQELWKRDGTAAGTVLVKDIRQLSAPTGRPPRLTRVGGTGCSSRPTTASTARAVEDDGTEAGTALVKDINRGPAALERLTQHFTASDLPEPLVRVTCK